MKFLILVALLSTFIQRGLPDSSGQVAALTCISTQNMQSYSEKIATFLTQNKAPVDDAKLNKFMNCYWKNKGLLNEDGNIDAGNLQTYLENIFAEGGSPTTTDKIIARSTVDRCKDTRVKDPGQKAIIVQNCITAFLMENEASKTQMDYLTPPALLDLGFIY